MKNPSPKIRILVDKASYCQKEYNNASTTYFIYLFANYKKDMLGEFSQKSTKNLSGCVGEKNFQTMRKIIHNGENDSQKGQSQL